jgi:hypothetical protein
MSFTLQKKLNQSSAFFKRLQAPKNERFALPTDAVLVDEKIYFLATAENTFLMTMEKS